MAAAETLAIFAEAIAVSCRVERAEMKGEESDANCREESEPTCVVESAANCVVFSPPNWLLENPEI